MTGDYADNGLLELSASDRRALEQESGIAPAVVEAGGAFTLQRKADLPRCGFKDYQIHLVPGLVLPLHSLDGETIVYQIRPHVPRRDADGKPIKYELPQGARLVLECNPLARPHVLESQCDLFLTEGCKKAAAAVSRGLACLSLSGVDCWQQNGVPLPEWYRIPLKRRVVTLIFDHDANPASRRNVYFAARRLAQFLKSRGAVVHYILLPLGPNGEKTGLDDYFARDGGTKQSLLALASPTLHRPPEAPDVELCRLPQTDIGNAQRLAARYGEKMRYCPQRRSWYLWTGTHWRHDEAGRIMAFGKETATRIWNEAAALAAVEPDASKQLAAWGTRSQNISRVEAMIKFAQSEPDLSVSQSDLDADPMLLACGNGTLDLNTCELREHRDADLITVCLDILYQPDAPCPEWHRYLNRVQPDPQMRAFLQRAAGYSLTGDVGEECLFFLHGSGRNGKSKFVEAIKYVFGPVAFTLDKAQLMRDRSGCQRGPTSERVALKGMRFVPVSELQDGDRLDEAIIKSLTGGDTITGREMYSRVENFTPTHKLWLAGNHKPRIHGIDAGIWSRIRLVHFAVTIPVEERDPHLLEKLKAERPGILAWCVEGLKQWRAQRLNPPAQVTADTDAYQKEEDALAEFLSDCCLLSQTAKVAKASLWQAYERWAIETSDQIYQTQRGFNSAILKRPGIQPFRATGGAKAWRGIGLTEDKDPPTEELSLENPSCIR